MKLLERESTMKLCGLMFAAVFTLGSSLAFAQGGGGGGGSAGGGAAGGSGGTSGAAASPRAGSPGAGSLGTSGVPSGPANPAGLNNSGNDPSGSGRTPTVNSGATGATTGLANPSRDTPANREGRNPANPPRGTNSAGTADSSGGGSLRSNGTRMPGPSGPTAVNDQSSDAKIEMENKKLDRTVRSICRGC
jgi:hypothetical protein